MKKLYGITIILLVTLSSIFAQTTGRYRVSFADKKNSQYSIDTPQEFLSEKAIARRSKQNISYSIQDIPVNQWYIDSILACGAKLCNVSKWFNSAIFVVDSLTNISKIQSFSFVKSVEWVAPLYVHDFNNAKLQLESIPAISYNDVKTIPEKDFYGDSYNQIALMNGIKLHKDGFMGQGMTLAIIDAGFLHVDSASSFVHLWKENRVIGVRDFSGSNVDVFTEGYHGMACFSLISSFIPGKLVGTAPRANFYLLHSEEGATEYKVEEDNWTAAAEFADSVGVDVISTSLGYSEFDDTTQNYKYSDVDGNTMRITIASDIAASKGILLVNSAGNNGAKPWKYITAPGDADSIITVGACFANGSPTKFSSRGPTADGRIKPDVMAQGYYPAVLKTDGLVYVGGMGTSFSAPIFAGMVMCLWQEFPNASAQQIKAAVIASADRHFVPDTINGNGIPDFEKARYILKMNVLKQIFDNAKFYPNPFYQILQLQIESSIKTTFKLEMFDAIGNCVIQKSMELQTVINQMDIPEVTSLKPGIYIAIVSFGKEHEVIKLVKSM
jgi:subtilisin family serine protease